MAVQKMQVVVQKMQVEIKTKLVTFVTDNVLLVGIVGNKNLLARMLQDKER
jgi:DNA-binding protein YbaB